MIRNEEIIVHAKNEAPGKKKRRTTHEQENAGMRSSCTLTHIQRQGTQQLHTDRHTNTAAFIATHKHKHKHTRGTHTNKCVDDLIPAVPTRCQSGSSLYASFTALNLLIPAV